jgi:hypothetical protein
MAAKQALPEPRAVLIRLTLPLSLKQVKLVLKHNRFWVETADTEVCCWVD